MEILEQNYLMHELAVTENILALALEAAQQANARRITAINLVIGDLSSFVDESVQFYFDLLSRGTIAEGAVLRFRREHAVAICRTCGHQFQVSPPLLPICPNCGDHYLEVKGGQGVAVDSIEVSDGDEAESSETGSQC
ncbi:MAG: hydrogenase maturation nickel metallochaperone HypA [Anaerolineae bacterium]|nr:hydrogenase maturation nickel metallochaperone HypA [Anaerolineae bacterium]MDW8071829.1 hydrogenase maturation nickel metallochaperone HypA [Anaerolineae bacterium]